MRITVAVIGILSVFFAPPWLPLLCIVLLSVRYRAWEAIAIGAFIDLTWLPTDAGIHSLPLFTIAAIVIVWGFEPLRAQFLAAE